jgi:hypothetical protein
MVAGYSPIPPVIGVARGFHLSLHPIGHELAHVYLGEWPARLPVLIEEGVADLVGGEASGTLDPIRGQHAQVLATCRVENVVGLLAVSRREFLQVPTRQIAFRLRAVGFSIADRAGLDTIRALSRMAADQGLDMIPADWFLPYWNEPSGS